VIDITADGLEVFCKALQGSEQNINSAPVKYSMALALRNSNKKTNQDMEKAITAFRSERSQHDPAIYPSLVAGVLDGDVDLTKMVQRMLEKTAMRMSVK
jgi:transcription termination factor NusB